MARRWLRPSPAAVETAATVLFTGWVAWPFLRLDGYVTSYDVVAYAGPNAVVSAGALRAGRLPQWLGDIYGGTNFLGNPQVGFFNPLKAVTLALTDPARALDLTTGIGLFVMAAGMLVLLRRLHLRPPAAGIGAAIVIGGGVMMARSTQPEQVAVLVWVPWLLAAVDHAVATPPAGWRPAARCVAPVAAAVGLVLLAGHPQQVYLSLPLTLAWAVVRAVDASAPPLDAPAASSGATATSPARTAAVMRRLGRVVLGAVLGAGIAAAQLATTALLLPDVALAGRNIEAAQEGYTLRPELVASALLGSPLAANQPATAESFEAMTFVGAAAAVLAVIGLGVALAGRARRATGIGLAALVVAGTIAAMGPQCVNAGSIRTCDPGGAPYRLAARIVPGFTLARVPGRWMFVVTMALAVLAAVGVDALARRWLSRRALSAAGIAGAVALGLIGLTKPEFAASHGRGTLTGWLVAGGATLAVALLAARRPADRRRAMAAVVVPCLLVAVELGVAQRHSVARAEFGPVAFSELGGSTAGQLAGRPGRIISRASQREDDLDRLSAALKPNTNVTQQVPSLEGYDGGVWLTEPWVTAVGDLTAGAVALEIPLNWQMRDPIDPEAAARLGVRWAVVDAGRGPVVATGWRGPTHTDGDIEVWENPAWRGTATFVPSGANRGEPVAVERSSPEELRLRVEGGSTGGVVAAAEQPLPGWTATVDGGEPQAASGDGAPGRGDGHGFAIAASVPPGTHEVVFTYAAPGLRAGLLLSAIATLVTAGLWVLGRRRPSRPGAPPGAGTTAGAHAR